MLQKATVGESAWYGRCQSEFLIFFSGRHKVGLNSEHSFGSKKGTLPSEASCPKEVGPSAPWPGASCPRGGARRLTCKHFENCRPDTHETGNEEKLTLQTCQNVQRLFPCMPFSIRHGRMRESHQNAFSVASCPSFPYVCRLKMSNDSVWGGRGHHMRTRDKIKASSCFASLRESFR